MRYESKEDLPDTLQDVLPEEAQDIYINAYQKSWDSYEESVGGDMDRASVAHRDAMHAVKQEFEKDEETGKWYPMGELPEEEEEEEEGLLDKIKDAL